jgi:hypothetical protein
MARRPKQFCPLCRREVELLWQCTACGKISCGCVGTRRPPSLDAENQSFHQLQDNLDFYLAPTPAEWRSSFSATDDCRSGHQTFYEEVFRCVTLPTVDTEQLILCNGCYQTHWDEVHQYLVRDFMPTITKFQQSGKICAAAEFSENTRGLCLHEAIARCHKCEKAACRRHSAVCYRCKQYFCDRCKLRHYHWGSSYFHGDS